MRVSCMANSCLAGPTAYTIFFLFIYLLPTKTYGQYQHKKLCFHTRKILHSCEKTWGCNHLWHLDRITWNCTSSWKTIYDLVNNVWEFDRERNRRERAVYATSTMLQPEHSPQTQCMTQSTALVNCGLLHWDCAASSNYQWVYVTAVSPYQGNTQPGPHWPPHCCSHLKLTKNQLAELPSAHPSRLGHGQTGVSMGAGVLAQHIAS